MRIHAVILLSGIALVLTACEPASETDRTVPAEDPDASAEVAVPDTDPMEDNPLLEEFITPARVPPFHLIEPAHFEPAFEQAMADNVEEIRAIAENPDPPDFENTVEALDEAGLLQHRLALIFYTLRSAHPETSLEERAPEIVTSLSRHRDQILADPDVFERVEAVWDRREELDLEPEQHRLLEETYRAFVRGGARLDSADRDRVMEINAELAGLAQRFNEKLRAESRHFELVITREADLDGLPESAIAAASRAAYERGRDGDWVFTLQRSSFLPFMANSGNRELRREMLEAWANRGMRDNTRDTRGLIAEMAGLRAERAGLMGYDSHAHMVLADAMVGGPGEVRDFIDRMWEAAAERAAEESDALAELAAADGLEDGLEPWDWWYYREQLRRERFDLDDEHLRPYFSLQQVTEGAFRLANRLWNLTFHERTDLPTYYPDVRTYEIRDQMGDHLGILYLDYMHREEKQDGAWTSTLRYQSRRDDSTAVMLNVANFVQPTGDRPASLGLDEVRTVFHEFGHALHGFFSDVEYRALAGNNVPDDFVEFPAELMELWALKPEMLRQFAFHHETGAVLPDEKVDAIQEARRFGQGFAMQRYLASAYLDLAWHGEEVYDRSDAEALEAAVFDEIGLDENILPRYRSSFFEPAFGQGRAGAYFNILWAELLAADVFSLFEEDGVINRRLAGRLREEILSRGNTRPPLESFEAFMGRGPSPDALLQRRGLDAPDMETPPIGQPEADEDDAPESDNDAPVTDEATEETGS